MRSSSACSTTVTMPRTSPDSRKRRIHGIASFAEPASSTTTSAPPRSSVIASSDSGTASATERPARSSAMRIASARSSQPTKMATFGRGSFIQPALPPRVLDCLDAARDVELAEDVLHVVLDRVIRERELQRDLAITQSPGHEPEDVELARGEPQRLERLRSAAQLRQLREAGEHRVGHGGRRRHLAADRERERVAELHHRGGARDVALRAGFDEAEDRLVRLLHPEDEQLHAGMLAREPRDEREAFILAAVDVDHDDVGMQLRDLLAD